ncbi:hypothetical protein D3C81_813950 [compost metagenome]
MRIAQEDFVTEQVLALQAIGADFLHLAQPLDHEVMGLLARGRRQEIRKLVVEAGVALERGLQRVQPHRGIPVLIVDAVQLAGLVLVDRQRCRRRATGRWTRRGARPGFGGAALRRSRALALFPGGLGRCRDRQRHD